MADRYQRRRRRLRRRRGDPCSAPMTTCSPIRTATVRASPEETAQLTGGKDLSAFLPYEDGGLLVPLFIRGPLRKPVVMPDMDALLRNAAAGLNRQPDDGNILDALSASDRKNVEKGLSILHNLLAP